MACVELEVCSAYEKLWMPSRRGSTFLKPEPSAAKAQTLGSMPERLGRAGRAKAPVLGRRTPHYRPGMDPRVKPEDDEAVLVRAIIAPIRR